MPRTKKTVESAETVTKTAEISEAMEETKKERKTKTKGDSKQPYHKGYHVTYWFIQPLLGSAPSDPDLYKRFIASNAPDAPTREEELTSNTVEEVAAKGVNIFVRRKKTGYPAVGQHTIKGYLKESLTAVRRQDNSTYAKMSSHKSKIVGNVTIKPVWVNLHFPENTVIEKTEATFKETGFGRYDVVKLPVDSFGFQKHMLKTCDRPLQADTNKGKITSIASSEVAPAGTTIEYDVWFEASEIEKASMDMLVRGCDHGTGQWRGSGEYGAFVFEAREIDDEGNIGEIAYQSTKKLLHYTSEDEGFEDALQQYIDDNNL